VGDALREVEASDSDGDGVQNGDEIRLGTLPGDPLHVLMPPEPPSGPPNPSYAVGQYDPVFAYRRVSLGYCGVSPGYEEVQNFLSLDSGGQNAALHSTLDACLTSGYWRMALERLADKRVRPIGAIRNFSDYE
jgi:hypothetical protein